MPNGPNGERRPGDTVGATVEVAKIATGEIEEKLPHQGKRKAGQAGGVKRAERLTQERRSEIARKAGNSQGAHFV